MVIKLLEHTGGMTNYLLNRLRQLYFTLEEKNVALTLKVTFMCLLAKNKQPLANRLKSRMMHPAKQSL
jgi:hypothetical protein